MFEKEAEEYIENPKSAWKQGMTCVGSVRQAFKDGAEFGYNKANEWHNIKENPNDLPNDGDFVLADNLLTTECVKFKKEKDGNCWRHDKFELCNMVYWKEIVPPKEE